MPSSEMKPVTSPKPGSSASPKPGASPIKGRPRISFGFPDDKHEDKPGSHSESKLDSLSVLGSSIVQHRRAPAPLPLSELAHDSHRPSPSSSPICRRSSASASLWPKALSPTSRSKLAPVEEVTRKRASSAPCGDMIIANTAKRHNASTTHADEFGRAAYASTRVSEPTSPLHHVILDLSLPSSPSRLLHVPPSSPLSRSTSTSSLGSRGPFLKRSPSSSAAARLGASAPASVLRRHVTICGSPHNTYHEVTPYARIYGKHPAFFDFNRNGEMTPTDAGIAEELRNESEHNKK